MQPFTMGVDSPEITRLMEVSIMFNMYCVLTYIGHSTDLGPLSVFFPFFDPGDFTTSIIETVY